MGRLIWSQSARDAYSTFLGEQSDSPQQAYAREAKPIELIPFVDGVSRPVFLDEDGRQYVIDNDGNRVYGVWIYIDEPDVVEWIAE